MTLYADKDTNFLIINYIAASKRGIATKEFFLHFVARRWNFSSISWPSDRISKT